jgi:archaellum biogenesis ATPase FlaH
MAGISSQYKQNLLYVESDEVILSGYKKLDERMGGFRYGECFMVGGIAKSGKSSYLMKMVINFLKQEKKVLYINTELDTLEFFNRIVAIDNGLYLREVEKDTKKNDFKTSLVGKWTTQYEDQLFHYGISDLVKDDNVSSVTLMDIIKEKKDEGCKIVIIDNLTTYKINTKGKQEEHERLSKIWTKLINYAKKNKILVFVVLHSKDVAVWRQTPDGIKTLFKAEKYDKVFEESNSFVLRPGLTDFYGGAAIKSQITGALLIWRPYQNIDMQKVQKYSALILDSFRRGSNAEIKMLFYGDKLSFEEFVGFDEPETSTDSYYINKANEEEE